MTSVQTTLGPDSNDSQPQRRKFGGRVKGTPNKVTATAKEAIAIAAEKMGGTERLVEWAKEDPANERLFWSSIYPKLLPLQLTGEGGGPVAMVGRIELVPLAK